MTNVCTASSLSLRRTAPAAVAPSVRIPPNEPLSTAFKPVQRRSRRRIATLATIRSVHRGKTVLPHLLKTRYKFHGC